MAGKQDDADHATTRHVRAAMTALDKIGAADVPVEDILRALDRVERYGGTVASRVLVQDAERARERGEATP